MKTLIETFHTASFHSDLSNENESKRFNAAMTQNSRGNL